MGGELLDWIFAAGQGLFGASLFYFLYLVVKFSRIASIMDRSGLADPSEQAPSRQHMRLDPAEIRWGIDIWRNTT